MFPRARHILHVVTAAVLLLTQAVPAYARCVCHPATGEACCTARPRPDTEADAKGCATPTPSAPAAPSGCCSSGTSTSGSASAPGEPEDLPTLSHACAQTLVVTVLASAVLPAQAASDVLVPVPVALAYATLFPRDVLAPPADDHPRGPPRVPRVPIYLLNASFLA